MKTVKLFISFLLISAFVAPAIGMSAQSHRGTLLQALEILQKGSAKQRWVYGYYAYHASRNGTSPQATIAEMGPKPDNFLDTVIGGWWIGYRYFIEVQFLTSIGFTSYWHFTSAERPGKYGDRYSGYSYQMAPEDGFFGFNTMVKRLLYNQEIQSGSYENAKGLVLGLKDIFQIVSKNWLGLLKDFYMGEKGSSGEWGLPGAPDVIHDYQTQTASTDRTVNGQYQKNTTSWRVPEKNWDDIQDTYFNPGANAGQFWYNQFTHNASFDDIKEEQLKQLGYAMHWIADGATVQHVWSTTDHNHTDFESYMDEMISGGFKVDRDAVEQLIQNFENSEMYTYAQKHVQISDLDNNKGKTGNIVNIADNGVKLKDIRVNGEFDYTMVSAGDILRWLAQEAIKKTDVLSDDSEETFTSIGNECLTLAVAGEILLMTKGIADLYKAKQYEKKMTILNDKKDIWGNNVIQIGSPTPIQLNQIR